MSRLTASQVSDALWETMREYGVSLEVGEQTAVAQRLAHDASVRAYRRRFVTALDVKTALARTSRRTIPLGFGKAVEHRLRRTLAILDDPPVTQ